jgi:hypothetical protein
MGPVVGHDVDDAGCEVRTRSSDAGMAQSKDLWRRSVDVGALRMRFGQMAGFHRMASLTPGIGTALNIVARRIPA